MLQDQWLKTGTGSCFANVGEASGGGWTSWRSTERGSFCCCDALLSFRCIVVCKRAIASAKTCLESNFAQDDDIHTSYYRHLFLHWPTAGLVKPRTHAG
jgi:hypothetical protein